MTRKISAIKVQKKDQNRLNIYLDGEFAFGLTRITAAWLQVGQELTDQEVARLSSADEIEVAYLRALHFLSFRPRSTVEVQNRLSKYGYLEPVTTQVINRLGDKGYIDDRQFAETWIENRNAFRPRSHRMLRWELRNKNVDDEVISSILSNSESEENLARAAAEKYVHKLHACTREQFYQRLGGFLGRRGFPYGVIAPLLIEFWAVQDPTKSNNEKVENEVNNVE